jgi:hypothetical protein
MNPNGSTRGIRDDPELQAGYGVEYSESRFRVKTRWVFGDKSNRSDSTTKVVVCVNPMNSVLRLYLTATTGQGASRITYWAVEPNTNLPTFDLLLTPIMISSILLSLA